MKRKIFLTVAIFGGVLLVALGASLYFLSPKNQIPIDRNNISVLALGDSYTVGESVPLNDSWPFQLIEYGMNSGINITQMDVIAQTGWSSEELLQNLSNSIFYSKYDFIFIAIGVNDQFQGVPPNIYEENLQKILEIAFTLTHAPITVIMLSIPDYSLSPSVCGCAKAIVYQEIDALNNRIRSLASRYGVNYIDITWITRNFGLDPTMYGEDQLHFSGKMYRLWVEEMVEKILEVIEEIM